MYIAFFAGVVILSIVLRFVAGLVGLWFSQIIFLTVLSLEWLPEWHVITLRKSTRLYAL